MTRADVLAVLRKHADSRGRVDVSVDRIQTIVGLDAHDVHKRLFELQQDGAVTLRTKAVGGHTRILSIRLRLGAANTAALAASQTPDHSVPELAWAWLERQPTQFGGWIMTRPTEIRAGIGLPENDNRVAMAVSGWARQGRIALRKEGSRIVAIRINPGAKPGRGAASVAAPAPAPKASPEADSKPAPELPQSNHTSPELPALRMPETPALDQYVAARRIANLAPEGNPYLTVEFTQDAIAEEALALKQLLEDLLERKEHHDARSS